MKKEAAGRQDAGWQLLLLGATYSLSGEMPFVHQIVKDSGAVVLILEKQFHLTDGAVKIHQGQGGRVREAPGYEFVVRNELSSAWFLLYQEVQSMLEARRVVQSHGEERIKSMLLYIQGHYRDRISLKEIADSASISERECLRCFSQNLNTTPFTYLNEYRIQKAAGELQQTNRPVTEIAYGCGFAGTSYFSKTFRKIMGCTPSEYRNGQRILQREDKR